MMGGKCTAARCRYKKLLIQLASELQLPSAWGLQRARTLAKNLLGREDRDRARGELLRCLAATTPEIRKRAADIARRISEMDISLLLPAAAQLAAILSEVPVTESRTRWHLGLASARAARSSAEVATAAELMWLLSEDRSNVVRCSAVEGLGRLALLSTEVRAQAEPYLLAVGRTGTPAMRCRARNALAKFGTAY